MKRFFQVLFFNFICMVIYSQDQQSFEQIERNDCRSMMTKTLNSTIKENFRAYTKENDLHLEIKHHLKKIPSKISKEQAEYIRQEAREKAIQALRNISGYIEDPQNICKFEFYIFHVIISTKDSKETQHSYKIVRRAFNNLSGNFSKDNLTFVLIHIPK